MLRRNFIKTALFSSFFINTNILRLGDAKSVSTYNGSWHFKEFNQILGGIKSNNYYNIRFSIDENEATPEKINEFNQAAKNDSKKNFDYYMRSFKNEIINSIKKDNLSKHIIYNNYADEVKFFNRFIESNGYENFSKLNSNELNELFSNFQNSIEWRKRNKDITKKLMDGASIVYIDEINFNKTEYPIILLFIENIKNIKYSYINIKFGKYSISMKKRLAFLKAKVNIYTNEMSFDTSLIFWLLDEKISK